MAGGTGGHVFPALALARMLRGQSIEVVWLGTRRGLEARIAQKLQSLRDEDEQYRREHPEP